MKFEVSSESGIETRQSCAIDQFFRSIYQQKKGTGSYFASIQSGTSVAEKGNICQCK